MESLLKPSGTTTAAQSVGAASVNAPVIEPDAKEIRSKVRAISSVDQIYSICEAAFDSSSERNVKNMIIADQFNDSPPFSSKQQKDLAEKHLHNFSTCFMSGLLESAISAPKELIDGAQYLTSASLPEKDDPDGSKTEAYRRKLTKLVRSWDNWDTHTQNIATENIVFGYAVAVCDDPDDWRPEEFRSDTFGVPDNTGQKATQCQFLARKKSFLIHELVEKIVDRQVAEAAGWHIDECIESLNEAMPHDRTQQGGTTLPSARSFVDLVRDGNAGASHDPEARTVDCYILLAVEPDGKVSRFIVTQNRAKLLYGAYDEYEKLSDIACFYSLSPGTGTLLSSKGAGRRVTNISKALERGRNKHANATWYRDIVWLKGPKGQTSVALKVFGNYGYIGSEAEVEKDAFPDNTEAWLQYDERMVSYAQQAIGTFVPSKPSEQDPGEKRTAHEVSVDAQREATQRAGGLKRFMRQFGDEMSMIAKRVCDPKTTDKEAKEFQEDLEENDGVTPELLKKLAEQPQGQIIEDLSQLRTQTLLQAREWILSSPFFDRYKYERELAVRMLGKELADQLMFKDGIDPKDEVAQMRQQIIENAAINSGESIPVSDGDNHLIHSKRLISDLIHAEPGIDSQIKNRTIDPKILDNVGAALVHGKTHVDKGEAQAKMVNNEEHMHEFAQHRQFYEAADKKLHGQLEELRQHKLEQMKAQPPQPPMQPGVIPQPQPGQEQGQPQSKEPTFGGLSERIIIAMISNMQTLTPDERERLRKVIGDPSAKPSPNGTAPMPQNRIPTEEPQPAASA